MDWPEEEGSFFHEEKKTAFQIVYPLGPGFHKSVTVGMR
jgi:hypothetical protein